MLSILIIDNAILDHYKKYAYFFDRFEDFGDVAVCNWNRQCSERDLGAMVPALMDTIKNVSEWNAYIICEPHDSMKYLGDDFKMKTQYSINPYERANREDYDKEEDDLLSLVYFLGGRGGDDVDYIDQYRFRASRPNNIYLITPRIFKTIKRQKLFLQTEITEKTAGIYDDPQAIIAGKRDVSLEYSNFWERYEYPPNCRFIVYDIPEPDNVKYQDCWFPFWLTVIIMTKNKFSNSILAPFKLHIIDVDIDDSKFENYINKFYTMLLDNIDINNHEITAEREAMAAEAASVDVTLGDSATPVYVDFPHVDVGELFASSMSIGMVKDKPVVDEVDWKEQMQRTRDAIAKFFKAIARGKNEAVDSMNGTFKTELPSLLNRRITKYDAEDLEDKINEDELRMIELNTGYSASRTEFEKRQRIAEKIVSTYMKRRMTKKVAITLGGICAGIYFVGFIPYLINSASQNITSFLIALVISLAAMSVPVVCSLIALKILKGRMRKLIIEYNGVISECYEVARTGSDIQGNYLTLLLDYMTKYQLMTNATFDNAHTKRIERLVIANATFDDAVSECKAIASLRNIELRRITDAYVQNMIDSMPVGAIYLYDENDSCRMALNSVEEELFSPFSFTSNFVLETEVLYECDAYKTKEEA